MRRPPTTHRTRPLPIGVAALALVFIAACGNDTTAVTDTAAGTAVPTSTALATTTSMPATTLHSTTMPATTTTVAAESMRGKRYCEVLLVQPINGVPSAEVYNTFPLNDCPVNQWLAMDAAAIAAERSVPLAVLNGPRFWLMDHVQQTNGEVPQPVSFGGMEMILRATVDIGSVGAGEPPYTEHRVNRKTVFGFDSGSTVFELVTPDGSAYVMQSWSQQLDPTLDEAGLATLGDRLVLPAGWIYRVRTLTEPLDVVTTDQDAVVLQDEFKNTYSKETPAG
jgi:hypothetical protein